MKKIIASLILILCLAFSGCIEGKSHDYTDGTTIHTRHFTYNGHKYIEFIRVIPLSHDNYTGYVHDPDCHCGKH
jgi:hypothetical protein